jgi:glycine/D-amino acid oxidase-like deaminating enzyme
MPEYVDFCILGAGIAGLSLADALQEHAFSVMVVEQNEVASGASGTPGALVNPATGRRATKSWKAEQCYRAIRNNLEKVQAFAPGSRTFYHNNGLLRPALSQKMVRKMQEQFEKTTWPEGWCLWQTEKEIKERHPGINCTEGGLWLPIGLTVHAGAYLAVYAEYLRAKNVAIKSQCEVAFERESQWVINAGNQEIRSDHLVFATGFSTIDQAYWDFLPLEGVKGQLGKFKADRELLNFDHSISSLGYIARIGKSDEFIQGSTYEHDFEEVKTDQQGAEYLRKRMARTLPELAEKAKLIEHWAGVRLYTPDKKPVLGRHPEIDNLHIITALGSKGLLHGKYLAEQYVDHLKNGTNIFPKVSIERYS